MLVFGFLILCMTPQKIQVEERMRVAFVSLDVTATHKKSGPVTNLTKDDFIVTENGKRVSIERFEIKRFDQIGGGQAPNAPTSEDLDRNAPLQPTRQVVFVMDLEASKHTDPFKALDQVEKTLLDLKAQGSFEVALYSMESGMITDGFTSNFGQAIEALKAYRKKTFDPSSSESDSMLFAHEHEKFKVSSGPSGSVGQLTTESPDLEEFEEGLQNCMNIMNPVEKNNCIQATLQDFVYWQSQRSQRVMGELESLAYSFKENSDLKIMLFISPGFGLNSLMSAQKLANMYKRAAQGQMDANRTTLEDISTPIGIDVDLDFKRVVHACIKNRVIFNTFDIFQKGLGAKRMVNASFRGVTASSLGEAYSQYRREMDAGLKDLAEESGGTFHLTGDLTKSVDSALEQQKVIYEIGYLSPPGKPGAFRKIKIKVKKGKVKLAYRAGYFGL